MQAKGSNPQIEKAQFWQRCLYYCVLTMFVSMNVFLVGAISYKYDVDFGTFRAFDYLIFWPSIMIFLSSLVFAVPLLFMFYWRMAGKEALFNKQAAPPKGRKWIFIHMATSMILAVWLSNT